MKKINRNYTSFFEYIGWVKPNPANSYPDRFRYLDGADDEEPYLLKKNEQGHERIIGYIYPADQMRGALYPFKKMGKDFVDTFKPYYSTGKLKRDLLQPLRGIKTFAQGVVSFLGGLFSLIIFPLTSYRNDAVEYAIYPLSWIIEGIANILRGATQVITSLLVYFIKLPLRGLLTFFQKEPHYAEDKPSIQRFVQEAKEKLQKIQREEKQDEPLYKLNYSKAYRELGEMKLQKQLNTVPPELLAQIGNEHFDYEPNKIPRDVLRLLGEIHRKYEKSVQDGWATRHDISKIQSSYLPVYNFFKKAGAIPTFSCMDNPKKMETEKRIGFYHPLVQCITWIKPEHQPPKVTTAELKQAQDYLNFFPDAMTRSAASCKT
jgi:hypothetical protein